MKPMSDGRGKVPVRYWLIAVTFTLSMLLYIDRVAIAVAKGSVTSDFGLNDVQFGWVLSAFALGYALGQIPTGMLADRWGARIMLAAVVTVWSIFTAVTGLTWGLVSLLIARFLFGVGEAGAYPTVSRAFFAWLPAGERGLAQGINNSGARIGAAAALPVIAWAVTALGWRETFFILGAVGIVWATAWYWWFRDTPADHPAMSVAELAVIDVDRPTAVPTKVAPLGFATLMSSRNMWLVMGQYFALNFTFFFCLTWLFPHLQRTYQLAALKTGFLAAAPLLGGALGNWVGGGVGDYLYRSGNKVWARRGPAMLGFFFATTGMLASLAFHDPVTVVACLTLAVFGADMAVPVSWALCIDIGRAHTGTVGGTMNTAGNLGAFVTSLAFPYLLLLTGSTTPFFLVGAALNVGAFIAWLAIDPLRPIVDGAAPKTLLS
jgi:MFS transporter, ACS family, glucarate transporter